MATVAPETLLHSPSSPDALPQTLSAGARAPAAPGTAVYRGDRWGLIFWLACAGVLAFLHISQHVIYLLR